jgi:hypothetical protein
MDTKRFVTVMCFMGALLAACHRQAPLTQETAKAAVEADGRFMLANPELMVADGELRCKYFSISGSRVLFAGQTCREFKQIGVAGSGGMAVVLPRPLPRRILDVGVPEVKKGEGSATIRWEWASEELPEYEASCFSFAPVESLALFEAKEGQWRLKDVILEKLITEPYRCP